jgi:hypothetical protein
MTSEPPERDWTAGLGLSAAARSRMRARVQAAEERREADREVKRAIAGEASGEFDPQTGEFVRSTWRAVT